MGNYLCCEDSRKEQGFLEQMQPGDNKVYQNYLQSKYQSNMEIEKAGDTSNSKQQITVPNLGYRVISTLKKYNFYQQQIQKSGKQLYRYGEDVYEGDIDQNKRPKGFGKMYKKDGSLFIGQFRSGKAEGKGAYIFSDGSFYNGDFKNNCAQSENGQYKSQQLSYQGGFKNNAFDGKGHEKGLNHQFQGYYSDGHKVQGQLSWHLDNQRYIYEGTFNNNNQFHGRGKLIQPQGLYQGDFINGLKEGEGTYKNVLQITYKGQYKNGKKHGYGTIINGDGTIAYEGQFSNGLPHGKGFVVDKGNKIEGIFREGLDAKYSEQE